MIPCVEMRPARPGPEPSCFRGTIRKERHAMNRILPGLAFLLSTTMAAAAQSADTPAVNANGAKVMPIAAGPFQGNVESLK